MEAFAKFGSDVDPVTMMVIERGRRTNNLLVQPQYSPMPVGEQVAVLYCGINNLLHDVPLERIKEFEKIFLEQMRSRYKESVLDVLSAGIINDDVAKIIEDSAREIAVTLK